MNLSTGVRFSEKITKLGQIEQLIGQIGDMIFFNLVKKIFLDNKTFCILPCFSDCTVTASRQRVP